MTNLYNGFTYSKEQSEKIIKHFRKDLDAEQAADELESEQDRLEALDRANWLSPHQAMERLREEMGVK